MRKRYTGLITPERDFEELVPAFEKLRRMSEAYAPTDARHMALQYAAMMIRVAAELITRRSFQRPVGNHDQIGSSINQAINHGVHDREVWEGRE